jgi:TPR repeat protein
MAELNGELGLANRKKEGFKWLKRVAELAESSNSSLEASAEALADDPNSPGSGAAARQCAVQALHELALLHERGIDNVVFVDNEYAAELLARASELGYAPSAYKLGECYEYGRMGCPQDSALSIHYYSEFCRDCLESGMQGLIEIFRRHCCSAES